MCYQSLFFFLLLGCFDYCSHKLLKPFIRLPSACGRLPHASLLGARPECCAALWVNDAQSGTRAVPVVWCRAVRPVPTVRDATATTRDVVSHLAAIPAGSECHPARLESPLCEARPSCARSRRYGASLFYRSNPVL